VIADLSAHPRPPYLRGQADRGSLKRMASQESIEQIGILLAIDQEPDDDVLWSSLHARGEPTPSGRASATFGWCASSTMLRTAAHMLSGRSRCQEPLPERLGFVGQRS